MRRLPLFLLSAAIASPVAAMAQNIPLPELVSRTESAVVLLKTFDVTGMSLGQGSGFIIPDGRIATNAHVLEGASRVEVFDSRGQLLGATDHVSNLSTSVDLAILPRLGLVSGSLPLASGELVVGEEIVTFGSRRGLTNTVSDGIVSGIRVVDGGRWIQITSPISAGSSGGPVLNRRGEVVGISVSQLVDGQNLNFAIPVRDLQALAASPTGRLAFPASRATIAGASSTSATSWAGIMSNIRQIGYPSVTDGRLESSDLTTDSESRYDIYRFEGVVGTTVTVAVVSDDFDTYLELGAWDGFGKPDVIATNDDARGETNSLITAELPRTGTYLVSVTSYTPSGPGDYTLGLLDPTLASSASSKQASGATDGRWTVLGDSDGMVVSVDMRSIRRVRANLYEAWSRFEHPVPERLVSGEASDESVTRELFDCDRRRSGMFQTVYYSSGRIIENHTWSDNPQMAAWIPGSINEGVGETVCGVARDRP